MRIEPSVLKQLIEQAFDEGYWNHDSSKENFINSLLEPYSDEVVVDDGFRIWTIEELQEQEHGATFEHSEMGICRVEEHPGEKMMIFNHPLVYHAGFHHQGYPWSLPMKKIS